MACDKVEASMILNRQEKGKRKKENRTEEVARSERGKDKTRRRT